MAKRNTLEHPKVLDLAHELGIMACFALGIVEAFWHHVAKYHEDGEITGIKPWALADSIRYTADGKALLDALITTGLVDQVGDRLIVHGWSKHADDATQTKLFRAIQTFADGTVPKPAKIGKDERTRLDAAWAEMMGAQHTPAGGPPGSLPKPKPMPCINPPTPQGGSGPSAESAKPKRKPPQDHSEGVAIPERLQAIPGFEATWKDRRDQRQAKPSTRFPTPTAAEKELAQLVQCRDPVDVLNRAIAGSWQGLNIKPSDRVGWAPGQPPGATTTAGTKPTAVTGAMLFGPKGEEVFTAPELIETRLTEGWARERPKRDRPPSGGAQALALQVMDGGA